MKGIFDRGNEIIVTSGLSGTMRQISQSKKGKLFAEQNVRVF